MNRNRGIWIVIGSILVIGILMTLATVSFVKGKDSTTNSSVVSGYSEDSQPLEEKGGSNSVRQITADIMMPEEIREKSDSDETVSPFGAALAEDSSDSGQQDNHEPQMKRARLPEPAESDTAPMEESEFQSPDSEPVITPITPDSKARTAQAAVPAEGADYYKKQLKELDVQIKKMRDDSADSNTYSMKALADKELKLWNREQNTIYEAVAENLSDDSRRQLEISQQDWIKERDIKAEEAAKKYSGGTMEELEYTASLAESTRIRAYQLIDDYQDFLNP